jgi:hypothetical protein
MAGRQPRRGSRDTGRFSGLLIDYESQLNSGLRDYWSLITGILIRSEGFLRRLGYLSRGRSWSRRLFLAGCRHP